MKKKIIISLLILMFLLIPIKSSYKDGGTTVYTAVLYKVIKWHKIDLNEPSGYKTGTEFRFFPLNLLTIKSPQITIQDK